MRVKLLFIVCLVCICMKFIHGEEYEYEYVEEDEEYEYVDEEVTQTQSDVHIQKPEPSANFGFLVNPGGGLMKISQLLVSDQYINQTSDFYECVKREDSFNLKMELVPAVVDDEPTLMQQVEFLKKKMEKVVEQVNKLTGVNNKESDKDESIEPMPTNTTEPSQNITESQSTKGKRLSFREKQALRMQQRKDQEAAREMVKPKFRLGAVCEDLICESCSLIVEEFANVIFNAIKDPKIKYIEQLTEGFCSIKTVSLKYTDMVSDICQTFQKDDLGYKETLIRTFEEDTDWLNVKKFSTLKPKIEKVCLSIGACQPDQFYFQTTPVHYTQDQWDEKCFTCQAFANNLEERLQLTRHVTESSIVSIVAETCDRLNLPSPYSDHCKLLVKGKLLDDISWLSKVHGESIAKKLKSELKFSDKLCQEIDFCKAWVEPEKLKEREIQATVEEVFF